MLSSALPERAPQSRRDDGFEADAQRGLDCLYENDPDLYELLASEHSRQKLTLSMVAASSGADPSVLACGGTSLSILTTEGYPAARFHAGCGVADEIERLAIARAISLFGATYANVQPHSCSTANLAVMLRLLKPGDTILGLDLKSGGHLTHGSKASFSGKYFNSIGYGLDGRGLIDYDRVRSLAQACRPSLIIAGASAYPREIRFDLFREIADEAGAYLLADISHIAGLVVSGLHQSPIDFAHVTTTSTYKQLFGPRGGLILLGRDRDVPGPDGRSSLAELMQKAIFPFAQGTPDLGAVAAKARALDWAAQGSFRLLCRRILDDARSLATLFAARGYEVLTGGTDNHIVLISLQERGMTGLVAERALEQCGIVINKNVVPGDLQPPSICGGIRLGTNSLAYRNMGPDDMLACVELVDSVLSSLTGRGPDEFELDPAVRARVLSQVESLCRRFPLG